MAPSRLSRTRAPLEPPPAESIEAPRGRDPVLAPREAMKLRELGQSSGHGTVWPPQWVDSRGPDAEAAVPPHGLLEGLERLGRRLLLRINVDGQRRTASLQWDPPPPFGDIEAVLLGSIGTAIGELGERELPSRARR